MTKVLPPPGGVFLTGFRKVSTPKVCVESLCNLGGSGNIIASADVTEFDQKGY